MSNDQGLTVHEKVARLFEPEHAGLTIGDQARILGVSRASIYYVPKPVDPETLDLMNRMDKIHTDWPVYGQRKIAAQLMRDMGKRIGRDRVRSLMREMDIAAIYTKPHLSFNGQNHVVYPYLLKGVTIATPNQVWGVDITYVRMRGGFIYVVAFLDWYSRYVVSWEVSTTLEADFCCEAARQGMKNAIPGMVNMDQGIQFTSEAFIACWSQEKTKISMDHTGRCFDNIFTERFWRNLKYEEVYLKDYRTVREAKDSIGDYITRYNTKRLHEALGYKTPKEVYYKN